MALLRDGYLLLYNVCQAIGWAVALYQILAALHATESLAQVYQASGDIVGECERRIVVSDRLPLHFITVLIF